MKQAEMEQKDALNMRDNETKILIAQISAALIKLKMVYRSLYIQRKLKLISCRENKRI